MADSYLEIISAIFAFGQLVFSYLSYKNTKKPKSPETPESI